jgi:hypothetical protein
MSLLGNIIGGAIGFVVGGPVGAAAGAAIGGTKAAQDAADEAAKAAGFIVVEAGRVYMKYLEGVGKVYLSLGTLVVDAVEFFLSLPKGVLGMRPLRPSEKAIARRVFGNTIPLDRIRVSSLDGLSGRPFTVPGFMLQSMSWFIPGIGPLLAITSMVRGLTDKYILFLGNDGYDDAINYRLVKNGDGTWVMGPGQNLVHELTHVWQGHNNGFAWGYVVNSVVRQAQNGTDAYKYRPGAQWNTYDAEPQAHIVEDWFNGTLNNAVRRPTLAGSRALTSLVDPTLFLGAYIDCNIRPGLPNARTVFPTASNNPARTAITEVLKNAKSADTLTLKSAGSVLAARTLVPGATPIPTTYSSNMLVRTNPALKLR